MLLDEVIKEKDVDKTSVSSMVLEIKLSSEM